jgi:hypothetical protein
MERNKHRLLKIRFVIERNIGRVQDGPRKSCDETFSERGELFTRWQFLPRAGKFLRNIEVFCR